MGLEYETKMKSCVCEKDKNIFEEKNQLEEDYKTLGEHKLKLEAEVESKSLDLQRCHDQIFELEEKNMKLLDVLEKEQSRVSTLKAKVSKLSSVGEDETLENLIETFVEKVSLLCQDENLKISVASKSQNVKLKLATRAIPRTEVLKDTRTPMESTHLCEDELSKVHSFAKYANSKENEDLDPCKDQGKDLKFFETSDSETNAKITGSKEKDQELNTSMGLQLNKLCLNEPQSEKRLTRSMSRRNMK